MFIFRLVGFLVLYAIQASGDLKCEENQYKDGATNICMPCKACCPPRPQNQFCKKDCNLNDTCREPETTNLKIWPIVAISILIILAVSTIVILALNRKRISKRFQRLCTKGQGVQPTNPVDPTQAQLVNCHTDSATATKEPLIGGIFVPEGMSPQSRQSQFRSIQPIPNGNVRTSNRIVTPYSSLPLPFFLEKDGVRFIREDLALMRPNSCIHDVLLENQASIESIGSKPTPAQAHVEPNNQLRRQSSIESDFLQHSLTICVQCTEDLDHTDELRESSHGETPVKTFK